MEPPMFSPDGRQWWDGQQWRPTAPAPPAPGQDLRRAHWLIPACFAVLAIFLWMAAASSQGPFGLATQQSIGAAELGWGCFGVAAGYCIGRCTAWAQRR